MVEQGSTKKAILDKALDLFSVQGYEATSIAQIATRWAYVRHPCTATLKASRKYWRHLCGIA